ncbi:MAG TPA: hypothetical protein VIQ31_34980, partial [Phormidium sp.]
MQNLSNKPMSVFRSLSVAVSLVGLITIAACNTPENKENTSTAKVATTSATSETTNHNGHSSNKPK